MSAYTPVEHHNRYDDRRPFDDREREEVYSRKVRAGKRTYFFDVKATRSNDFYLVITESKKRADDGSYTKHKIFLYKEDFFKFLNGLADTIDYIKDELMPDYDFEADLDDEDDGGYTRPALPDDNDSPAPSLGSEPSTPPGEGY